MRTRAGAATGSRGAAQWVVWRRLAQARARERPGQLLATVLAIALGVALGVAVYLVNGAALNEFGLATHQLIGEADIVVRGPVGGFSEVLFAQLARDRDVSDASAVLEEQLALAGRPEPLKLIAIDPFRAAAVQPMLIGPIRGDILTLLDADAVILSAAAAEQLQVRRGERFNVLVGSTSRALQVIAILPQGVYAEPLALMDLAAAQWTLGQLGRINRIDLRLRPGTAVQAYRTRLLARLPPGVLAVAPEVEMERAAGATRAYRVNLNMLALVTLLTGAFLVFSTQWLSVLRRRSQLALLRALGVTRRELSSALLFEGVTIGALGSLLGVGLGIGAAAAVLQYLSADLDTGRLVLTQVSLAPALPLVLFFALGTTVSALGAWRPAREAARRAPALALKAGDAEGGLPGFQSVLAPLLLIGAALLLVALPPVHGLPLAGYAAVAMLLLGSVLLAPSLMRFLLARVPRTGQVSVDTALAQLKGSIGLSAVSLAAIIVSFSLMVAMTIMVHSFRDSFELWLGKMLPADLQLRVPMASDTAVLSGADQEFLATLPGIARAEFRRTQSIYLRADRPAVTLIARDGSTRALLGNLPLVRQAPLPWPSDAPPIWVSEALQDLYGLKAGDRLSLPIAGREQPVFVAGIWRDYVRPGGALVMERALYIRLTGDANVTEAALWLKPGANAAAFTSVVQAHFGNSTALELVSTDTVRSRSLQIFDRAFAMTYALEIIAVVIGLVGVAVAASSTALARRAQFGMLRHLGMLRAQVLGMLACDGLFMSALGVLYGLTLGVGLSLVLIYVINRQSFNWSIDLSVPWGSLAALSGALIAAVTLTAVWSGRAALGEAALRAVREDW